MQWQVTLTIAEAEDVFEITEQLKSLKGLDGVKLSGAVPRPQPMVRPTPPTSVAGGTLNRPSPKP